MVGSQRKPFADCPTLNLPHLPSPQRELHMQLTAAAGRADDIHLSIEQLHAAGDIGDPDALAVPRGIEAYAVIGHGQQDILFVHIQPDRCLGGARVFDDIVQLFLDDAE